MEDDFGIIDLSKPLEENEDQTDDFGILNLSEPTQTDDFGIPDLSVVSDAPPVSVSDQPSLKSDAPPIDPSFNPFSFSPDAQAAYNAAVNRDYYTSEYQAIELAKQAEAEAQKKAYLAERNEIKNQIIQDQMLNPPAPNVDIPVIGGEFKGGPQDFSTAFKYGDFRTRGNIQNLFADTEVELGGTGFMQFNQNMQNKLLPVINSVRSLVGAEPLPENANLRASIMKEIELERSAKSYLKAAEGLGFKPKRFDEIGSFSDFISWAKTTAGASGSPMLVSMASAGLLSPVVLGAELDANLREIEGLSREDRIKLSYRGGLIAGLLENLGIGILIKGVPDAVVGKLGIETIQKYAQKTYGTRVANQIVQVAIAEGLIEAGQEGTFISIEEGAGKEFKPGEKEARLTEALAGGAVIGGPLGGARAAVTEYSSEADKEAKAFIDSIDQAEFDQTPEQVAIEALQAPQPPQVKTEVQQPTVDSAASDTVDVTAQPDPSLTSDVPTDLTAPPKAEPPKVDTTPIEKPEVKTEFPQPNKSGVYSSDDVKPEDNFYKKLPGPAYTKAELQVLQIAPDKWITRSGISFSESGGSDPFNERNTFPTREAAILDLVQKKRLNETIREGDTKIVQRQKKAFGKFLDKILKDNGITPPTIDTTPIEKPEVKTEPPVKPVPPEKKDKLPAAAPITKTNTREITSQLDQVNLEAFIDTLRDKEVFNLRKGKNADDASPEELNKMLDEITQQEQIFTKFDRASIKKQKEIFAFLDEEISYYEESGRKAIPGFVDKEGKQLYYNQLSWAFTNYKEYLENLKTSRSKVDTKPPKPVKEKPPEVNPQEAEPIGTDTDGQVTSVQTPDGQKNYNVTGKVVELADLKQAQGNLQPRDRSKKESTALAVQRAGTMFNPQRLLNDPTSGSGAPIIARDGTIMSGNGRVLTMQEVYANQPKSLEAYQTALKEAGINTEGFSQPVFVRQLNDDMTIDQLKEFADLSNTEAQAQMTSTETAQRDAKRMPQNLINLYTGGDITSAENKSFVTGFAVQVLSPTEQGQFSVDGKPTKNAISRMQAAILATAYDDTDTLSIMLDSTDENIKAISNAMMASAPQLSQLKADIKDGNVKSDFDISKQIAEAAKTISNLRDQKVKPRDYFDQQDAFSQTDPLTEAIIKAFYNEELTRAKSQKFMTDVLNFYVQESGKRQENALFEDEVTPKDVIGAARKKAERKADGTDENQGSLLAEASPSKSVNESRKQTQSPKRTRSSKRLDADQPAAEVQEDELGGSTSDPSNVVTTTSGYVFDNVSQTVRQSIYRDAFADSGLSVDAIENKSTEAKFKILAKTVKDKFGLSGVKAPKGGGYTQVNQLLDAYHNLQWMTHALAMPNTFIGLDGKLSLELPDRVGRYLGAFESGSNNVIMPQRSNSFAHEFGHALDYYLMDKYGNLEEAGKDTRGISGLIRKTAKAGSRPWQDGTPVNVETAFGNMINALFLDNAELSYKIMQLEQAIAKGEAREAKTGVTTKSLEKLRNQLEKLLEGSGRSKVAGTKFKETSGKFGASVNMKNYYLRPTEMFARAFEAYIAKTVEAAGGRNEFITKGDEAYKLAAEQVKGSDIRLAETFPKDEERHNIFLAMDRLMDALRAESIAEGTVADAPGDTDMIDARANFWGSMQYEERNSIANIPKRVVQSIINDQKRAYRVAKGRAETLKLRPQKYAGDNLLERKINEYRDLYGGNFIETKRQILFNISDSNKENNRVRKIMENIISKVATDPGTRQNRVTKQTGTFEEAAKIESRRFYAIYDQIAKKYDIDLLTDAEQKSLRLLLTGESRATADASPKTLELAGELRRRLLNPIYDYMVKSGQDINYIQGVGYMPRMLDAPLAIQEKPNFMGTLQGDKGAVPLYRNVIFENEYGVFEEGNLDQIKALVKLAMSNPDKTNVGDRIANEYSELREIAAIMREQLQEINRLEKTVEEDPAAEAKIQEIIDSMDQEHFKLHEELRDPYALAAAEDWHTRITVREGADPSTNGVQGSYAKKRKLPPETDKYMNDFYLNPTDALMQYIPSAVRSTEFNRLFGKDLVPVGSKMKDGRQIDYLEYLIDEAKMAGMPVHQAQEVDTIVKMVTGRYPGPDGSLNKALNTINTFGTMALLPRAVLSSVAEPITAAIQTGSTVKGFQNFAFALDGLGASLRGKAAVERKMYYAQLANVLGVIDLPQTGEVVANRLGGTVAEDAKNTMRLATFFLRTGLTNITIAQRKASMRIGIQYIIEQAAQYNNPNISASLKEEARQTLRDFGINDTIIDQFTEFAQNLDKTDSGLYEIDQIMDVDGSLTDMGRVLATAVNRFVDQTIQDPKIVDRPKWAETPIGRIVFGIQSFIAAFQRNVLEMSVKRAARDFKTQGAIGGTTRLARKMLLPLFSLYVGHTLVSAAREFVFNQNKWEEEKEEEDRNIPIKYLMTLGISRSGLLGRLDPVFNGFFSLKYQADLSNVAVGATGAYYLKALQRIAGIGVENSPNTVSREYQAVRGFYDMVVPFLAGGLATIPGVSNTLGYGLGALDMAVTSPSVKHWVTRNIIYQMYNETYRPGQSSSNRGSSGFGSGGFGSGGFGD